MTVRLPAMAARVWLAIVVALIVGSACGGASTTDPPAAERPTQPASVRELSSIDTLRDQFERDSGRTRLILLISPT